MMKYDMEDPELSGTIIPRKAETSLGEVEYAEIGAGPVVLCLHGAMGGYDQSLILAQTVAGPGYRYIAVGRPGYLGTPISSGKTSEQQGDLIAALLDSLEIPRAGVIAVSGGGPAALQFGLRHPDRCAGLVLISTCADKVDFPIPLLFKITTFLARWPWFVNIFRKKAEKNPEAIARRSIRDPEILKRTISDPDAWPLFWQMLIGTYNRMGKRLAGTENDIRITRSATFPLENIDLPVLIIHGTEDPLLPFALHAKMFASRLPNAELFAVEGGEHVAIFTHREMVREKVSAFMQEYFTRNF